MGDPLGDGEGQLGDAGAAEGGGAELGEADEAEFAGPALADDLELVAELQPRFFGGGLVDRGFGRAARRVPFDVGERLEAVGLVRGDELGRELGADRVAGLGVEEAPGVKIEPAASRTPGVRWIRGSRAPLKLATSPFSCSTGFLAVTTTLVPFNDSLKISSKAAKIVSVRT